MSSCGAASWNGRLGQQVGTAAYILYSVQLLGHDVAARDELLRYVFAGKAGQLSKCAEAMLNRVSMTNPNLI